MSTPSNVHGSAPNLAGRISWHESACFMPELGSVRVPVQPQAVRFLPDHFGTVPNRLSYQLGTIVFGAPLPQGKDWAEGCAEANVCDWRRKPCADRVGWDFSFLMTR